VMSPKNECVETVKEIMTEVMHEKNALVGRLNAMHQGIAEEDVLVIKVRRKIEWAAEKKRSVEALHRIVASLQRALDEEDRSTCGSAASSLRRSASFAAPCVVLGQADFEIILAANIDSDFSFEAGAAEPRQMNYCSPAPLRKTATWPYHRAPEHLGKETGGGTASTPVSMPASSKAAGHLRSLSSGAFQLPQQVRNSLKRRALRFSASVRRRVGWDPAVQGNQWEWDYSV